MAATSLSQNTVKVVKTASGDQEDVSKTDLWRRLPEMSDAELDKLFNEAVRLGRR